MNSREPEPVHTDTALAVPAATGSALREWVTPENLNVAPGLLGAPLAGPWRRALAMLVDLAAIGVFSSLANAWLLAALALPLAERARSQRTGPLRGRRWLAWGLAVPLLVLGLQAATTTPRGGSVVDFDDDDDAAVPVAFAASAASAVAAATAGSQATAATLEAAGSALAVAALEQRVHTLEAELAKANATAGVKPAVPTWRERARRLFKDLGLGYGWSVVYFTLLPAWWRGQTLGKRLFGLRVVEITGKPMTALRNFKRYGGYVAGLATGGLGLAQLLWDDNRQAIQDKTAHTVVIDLRRPHRPTV